MDDISFHFFRVFHFRDKVGSGNIDEVARSKWQQETDIVTCGKIIGDETAQDHRESRDEIEPEGVAFLPSAVNQDAEVSEFLRDFVRGAGDPGDDSDLVAD